MTPDDVDLNRTWVNVAARVWQRRPGALERSAARLLRSPGLARALMTTPSLVIGWVLATVLVLAAGMLATRGSGTPYVAILAPGIAAVGIAFAYGPGVDPAWELSCSMAISDRMVLLVRALVVFALNAILGVAASAASGVAVALTFGWLLPMTAVCAIALAIATLTRSATVGAVAGVASWVITVLAGQATTGGVTVAITDSTLTLFYLAAAAGGAATVLLATRTSRGTS